jgi:TetR/AcrR family transcriptional repressor of nem operon
MNIKHDKDAVIKLGIDLICQKGYNLLGIDEICQNTGMTKGAFYNAFKSKENFLKETIKAYSIQNILRIQSKLKNKEKQKAINVLENFYFEMLEAQPKASFKGCFVNNMMAEMGIVNDSIGILTEEEFNKFIDAIVPTVVQAQEEGDLKKELDAREVTELIHATFTGY